MLRFLSLCLCSAALAFPSGLLSFGVKGGVPFTDAFNTATSGNFQYVTHANRYTVGPTFDINLAFGLGIEADLLYRRLSYSGTGSALQTSTTGNAWDVPLLLKWRTSPGPIRPYLSAGPTFRGLTNLNQRIVAFTTSETDKPLELRDRFNTGVTLGAGLQLLGHLSPELRYTRWGWANFKDVSGLFKSNPDQFEFLVGLTF